MPKIPTGFEFTLPVREDGVAAHRWLYESLRGEILEGRLRPGVRLPATRDLANQYELSRGTVVHAFELLKAEGYIDGKIGSGSYVSKVLPEAFLHVTASRRGNRQDAVPAKRSISRYASLLEPFPMLEPRRTRAFRCNLPAVDLFPIDVWTQLTTRLLRKASTKLLIGCEAIGYTPLREAVASYLASSRGVRCEAVQVVIVSGTQEALDIAARLLVNPGDRVCMEEPGYIGARVVFESMGAHVNYVTVDGEGMAIPEIRDARLAYITPGHQFPLGMTMSLPRRLALLDWAKKSRAVIFEDDYDSEYRYSGKPIPALQGLDRSGSVIFAGTFSKVLFPSLRLGYMVVPPDLVERISAMKSITTRHASLLDQAVLCDFIAQGHLARHLRRMREVYSERLSALMESARERLAGALEMSSIEAGLQTTGWLAKGLQAASVANSAAERDIDVTPLSAHGTVRSGKEGLQLGFAPISPAEIRKGVVQLAAAIEACGRRPSK